jgi:hypothetical protein
MAHVLTYLPKVETLRKWKDERQAANQSVVKRDWVPTGRIDFASRLNGNSTGADQPSEFKLLVEERRIVESIAGSENLEIQWRLRPSVMQSCPLLPCGHRSGGERTLLLIYA